MWGLRKNTHLENNQTVAIRFPPPAPRAEALQKERFGSWHAAYFTLNGYHLEQEPRHSAENQADISKGNTPSDRVEAKENRANESSKFTERKSSDLFHRS